MDLACDKHTVIYGKPLPQRRGISISSILLVLGLFLSSTVSADAANIDEQLNADISALKAARIGLQDVNAFLAEHSELTSIGKNEIPASQERKALLEAWQSFLDHLMALDVIGARANLLYTSESTSQKEAEFQLAYAAFLTQYRHALEFLKQTERTPALHAILNEPIPELGLPAGTYASVKFRFLHAQRAAEFVALGIRFKQIKHPLPLQSLIKDDTRYIMSLNEHQGVLLTAKNAGRIVSDTMFTAWFPLQKGVSEWMGDTKVLRKERALISEEQLHTLQDILEPGDILLVRREWYLSNIGLPGYWPHAALYIGTREERRAYFANDALRDWVRSQGEPSGDFEKLLMSRAGAHYEQSMTAAHGESVRVIEAISEGVSFTSLEHAGGGDSLVVLRPNRSPQVKARAISRAFHFAGRPYDFDFNFLTDASLVCTELIYKAYEGEGGLQLPLDTVMGRPVLPANRIAVLFDEEYDSPSRQLEFVAFLDGHEWGKHAIAAGVDTFRASWRRPKWYIFTQDIGNAQAKYSDDATVAR